MSHITQQQLESYLWGAAMLLHDTVDADDYRQFALFAENHRFQISATAHWIAILKREGLLIEQQKTEVSTDDQ